MAVRRRTAPYKVGDQVAGTSYVEPADRLRESPVRFAGAVVQVGSGWAGVDASQAYLWVRLASGREVKALIRDVERLDPGLRPPPQGGAGAGPDRTAARRVTPCAIFLRPEGGGTEWIVADHHTLTQG
ncbi:hypothetical protein [Streptomyces sp. NPDC054854]